ncbi:MAG: sigma-70 family RNA polymerase sigma factor [Myxococcaceae bacterium]|nr:sigma-70 family RNA polymerase sigma factor [Myxococcaceae bacterium]
MVKLSHEQRSALEAEVDAALAAGRARDAQALLIERYGPELLSFLSAVHHDRDAAAEVFSQTCEDLLRTFDGFRRECSWRTWLYALAKNASRHHREAGAGRVAVALSDAPQLEAARRTTTAAFMRTDWKDRFRSLRETLSPDDRALLVLRVDRDLPWEDVARVLGDGATPAALRKRFERIKLALKEGATQAGWLDP